MVSKYGDFFFKINSFVQLFQLVSLYFITLQQLVVSEFIIFHIYRIHYNQVCYNHKSLQWFVKSFDRVSTKLCFFWDSLGELNEFYCKYITQNIMVCKSFLRWLLPSWCMNQQTEQSLSVQTCIYISLSESLKLFVWKY